jgi:threonine/homoserine/homoserine lactone efflux protein
MSFEGWVVFASFWVVFVTTPGPNAVNCIQTAMGHGFRASLWCVAGILTQACLFLGLAAGGVTALIVGAPQLYDALRLLGAGVLVALGVRGWLLAGRPLRAGPVHGRGLYLRAFAIATFNAKSLAGYLAAFSQFVEPGVPIWDQMRLIVPTALCLTTLSYTVYCAFGAGLGKVALGAIGNLWLRRGLAFCFVGYGVALALAG